MKLQVVLLPKLHSCEPEVGKWNEYSPYELHLDYTVLEAS